MHSNITLYEHVLTYGNLGYLGLTLTYYSLWFLYSNSVLYLAKKRLSGIPLAIYCTYFKLKIRASNRSQNN